MFMFQTKADISIIRSCTHQIAHSWPCQSVRLLRLYEKFATLKIGCNTNKVMKVYLDED